MKKIIGLSLVLVLLSVAASAQTNLRKKAARNCTRNRVTAGERAELRQDAVRYKMLQRRAKRDGVVTPIERRRVQKARVEVRRDAFRFKHNARRRVI